MRTVILTESQLKKVIDGVISEQNESRTESITVNFGALWPMGKWKLTQQQTSQISDELVKIVNFINQNKGSKITIQLEAGESQVTNKDTEVNPSVSLQPGVLSQKRGESLKMFLDNYFKSLVGKTLSENELPEIPQPKTIIGQTPYSGPQDLKDKSKLSQYQSEQFVRAVISAEKNYECIVGLEVTIGYYAGKNRADHTCDEAIFELRMNGVSLGVVNLNNSTLDTGVDYVKNRLNIEQKRYNKLVADFDRQVAAGVYKERERKKIIPEPPVAKWPQRFREFASRLGYETVEPFIEELERINNSFKEYGRKSDGKNGGNRSQTFTLTGAQAKGIIDNSPSDKIVLSIIPLVSKDGKYKIFYQTGSHADTPWVTIVNRKMDKILYDGEPNTGMRRGSTTETVLLTTDLCGNPIQKNN
jgi:hypothetical protein